MLRYSLLATAFIACIAFGAALMHAWTGSHSAADLSRFATAERHDELAGDVLELKGSMAAIDPAASADELRTEIAVSAGKIEALEVMLADMQSDLHRLGEIKARVDDLNDGLAERLADRLFKVETDMQDVSGMAKHALDHVHALSRQKK